jgi:hypothetical protein
MLYYRPRECRRARELDDYLSIPTTSGEGGGIRCNIVEASVELVGSSV